MNDAEKIKKQIYTRVQNNIRFLRMKDNSTQEVLAKSLGINQSVISMAESGERNLTMDNMIIYCIYFKIDLSDLLFTNLNNSSETFYASASGPISKLSNQSFYLYYLNDDHKVSLINLNIHDPVSPYQAKGSIVYHIEKYSNEFSVIVNLDESYAYVSFHDYQKDKFFHLTFYYYRTSDIPVYQGGMGVLQHFDPHHNPVTQYCCISPIEIHAEYFCEMKKYLLVDKECDHLTLTKKRDNEFYKWLRTNIASQKR